MAVKIGDLIGTIRLDDQLTTQLRTVGGNIAMVGGAFTALGGTVMAAMAPIVKSAVSYETAMNKIRALTIASEADVKSWGQEILKLSGTVGKSPKELADALYFIASSGQVGATGFQILETSAKMAALGMGQTEEIARALVSTVNAYGPANLSAAQAGDILTRTVIEGGAQADEYANVLGRILPIASQLGVGLDEVGAFMATFTRLGVKGSEAATALRGTLNAIGAPGKQAAEGLSAMNLSGEQLRKMLADQGLVAVLELLMEKTGGNIEKLDLIIPNIRALTGVLGVAGKQGDEYGKILGRIKTSHDQLDKSFGSWSKTAAGQWAQFTSSVQAAAVELGLALLPALKDMLPTIKDIGAMLGNAAKWFASLEDGTRKWTVALIALGGPGLIALGGLVALIPNLVSGFGLLAPAIVPVTVAIVGFFTAFKLASWLIDSIPYLRQITTYLTDIAMKATGLQLVLDMYNRHLEKGTDALKNMTPEQRKQYDAFVAQQQAATAAWQAQQNVNKTTADAAKTQATANKETEKAIALSQTDIAAKLKAVETNALLTQASELLGQQVLDPKVAAQIVAMANAHKQAAEDAKKHAEEVTKLAVQYVGLPDNLNTVMSALEKLGDASRVGVDQVAGLAKELEHAQTLGVQLTPVAQELVDRWKRWEEADVALKQFNETLEDQKRIAETLSPRMETLLDEYLAISRAVELRTGSAVDFAGLSDETLKKVVDRLREIYIAAKEVGTVPEGLEEDFVAAFNELQARLGAIPKQIKNDSKSWGEALGEGFDNTIKNLPQTIVGAFQGGGDVWKAIGAQIGGDIGKSIGDKLGGKDGWLTKKLGDTLGSAVASLAGPLGAMLGSLLGKGVSKIGELLGIGGNKEVMKVNDLRDAFLEAHGGWLQLQKDLAALTDQDLVKKIFNARTVEEFEAATREVMGLLDGQAAAEQALADAVDRYGLTIEELGPKWQQQELDKMAAQLLQDYELLKASGADMSAVIAKMAPNMSEYVQTALAAGQSIPENMKPIIDAMIEQGLLLDENGVAYKSAEEAGITYTKSLTEGLMEAVEAIKQLVAALTGVKVPPIKVPIEYQYPGRPQGPDGEEPEPHAAGDIVTSPHVGLVGERGPEAIIPLDKIAAMQGRGDSDASLLREMRSIMTGQQRAIARAVRDGLLQAQ